MVSGRRNNANQMVDIENSDSYKLIWVRRRAALHSTLAAIIMGTTTGILGRLSMNQ
jgi:hypothetical protein